MPKAFHFENKYETQLFDTWSQTIKKMGSFRVHQNYFPHDMDVLYQRTLRLEQTKRDFLKMYKNVSHFLNYEHVLKNYFSTNMTGDLFEQNLAIKHTMKMLYSDRDQDRFDDNFQELVRLENKYFKDLYSYFESAYFQKQAEDTMEAVEGMMLLKKAANQKRRTHKKDELKNEFLRRSARIAAKETHNPILKWKNGSYFTNEL